MKHYLIIILAYHLALFLAVFDVYFHSTIIKGIKRVPNNVVPLANRLVLFVGDGLRADIFYGDRNKMDFAPFLRERVLGGAQCGYSFTRVPTESRPGHVAMIAGFYEDPSAVFKGWRENPVPFDSVFNQSYATFSWGSPDIVPIFSNDETNRQIYWFSYSQQLQDFSGKNDSAIQLNNWVHDEFRNFLHQASKNETLNELIHHNGVIFFFHLLAVDVAGHVRKPYSRYYEEAILNTDEIVENLTGLIDDEFHDHKTAYIFTSDHGMTPWGTHGAGSDFETHTPIICWGSGIKPSFTNIAHKCVEHMNQADVSVLISILLGHSIPVHSVGIIPINYLALDIHGQTLALLLNAKQLLNQYIRKEETTRASIANFMFIPYKGFTKAVQNKFFDRINYYINHANYEKAIRCIDLMIEAALAGQAYYERYFQNYKLFFVVLTYLSVIAYLFSKVADDLHYTDRTTNDLQWMHYATLLRIRSNTHAHMKKLLVAAMLFVIAAWSLTPIGLLYLVFPIPLFYRAYKHIRIHYALYCIFRRTKMQTLIYAIGLQLLFWSFFHRWLLCLMMVGMVFWPVADSRRVLVDPLYILLWSVTCLGLSVFPLFPVIGVHPDVSYVITSCVLWFTTGQVWIMMMFLERPLLAKDWTMMVKCGMVVPVILNIVHIEINFKHGDGLLYTNQVLSYVFLALYAGLMLFGTNKLLPRYFSISYSIGLIFTLFCSSYESIFMLLLASNLGLWLIIEMAFMHRNALSLLGLEIRIPTGPRNLISSDDLRRSFFYLFYTVFAFFGIGNIDSLNSFDIAWVRGFVAIFSPYLMMSLIFIKIISPFMLVATAFRLIMLKRKANIKGLFIIVLIFCDILGIEFLFKIQNVGSWLDIGRSLSHYVINQITTLILIGLYIITGYIIRPITARQ